MIHLRRGRAFRKKGKLEEAKKDLLKAEELKKDNHAVQRNLGLVYLQAGDYDKAKGHFLKASEDAKNFDSLGLAYYHMHDLEEALKSFDKALKKDPASATVHFHRGLVFLEEHKFQKAEDCLNTAIELDPNKEVYYFTRGQVYERQSLPELYDSAIEEFKKAIAINDMHPQSYFHLGKMYYAKSLYDDALACYNKVIELEAAKEEVVSATNV